MSRTILISGHFDPFHEGHLDYVEQAREHGDMVICVVSSDAQLMMKKGKVNIPEEGRRRIVDCILRGLEMPHSTFINSWDRDTLVAEALTMLRPSVFLRGPDKDDATMPSEEKVVCEKLGIRVIYAKSTKTSNQHGTRMGL